MNWRGIVAIYRFEMSRFFRTIYQSIVSPVLSTVLYFVVFGAAIGGRIETVEGVPYGAFIVPGLVMLSLLQQSITNAAFGIYFPKFTGTSFELFTAPLSFFEVTLGFVGAAATKSLFVAVLIIATSFVFVDLTIAHPFWAVLFLLLTALSFSLLGFILGIWARTFEQLNIVPMLVITPLVFLGGAFYSASMLPGPWQVVVKFNPVLYLISGFRWSFFQVADVPVGLSLGAIAVFLALCLAVISRIFRTGWRLKS
ncbi:ABC transporter permease [Celeribacter indicus]|uniref:Transport permease protein n=1 Tax=Celeribacter indicus TaxID=1208324 RepID=A0A0B5DXV2_9RHOB|nr:ABC transporter permease [Celeribacter indicus]AJE45566.1 ABC transporter [Celeribacter indicus]SDW85855.1 ABC-2 type transport system permease protein [Celeribacter indicus]